MILALSLTINIWLLRGFFQQTQDCRVMLTPDLIGTVQQNWLLKRSS